MLKNLLSLIVKIIILFILFILLVILNFRLWKKDATQEQEIINLQKQLTIQQQENDKTALVNAHLRGKISSLKRGGTEMIEEAARNGFGMVGKDETFYHFEDKKDNT
ncbi:MAG: septum formation initiator family protein, partial [Ostreibacterium sp.]